MTTPPVKRLLRQSTKDQPLRIIFTVPVLLQLIGSVGLVGYLSFHNGQKAVQNLASQLRSELSARIKRELEGYFSAPHAINRLNASAYTYRELDVVGATKGENAMFQQMKIYPTIAFVYCGSAQNGEFFGVLRDPKTGELQLSYGNRSNQFIRDYYSLNARGSRMHWLYKAQKPYDARTRPWFTAALSTERAIWTDVYIAFTTGLPNVTASLPVYDRTGRELLGVCGTDVVLPEEFRLFLSNLEIGKSGEAFVLDRQGHLISSSTSEPLMIGEKEDAKFLKAVDSSNPLVKNSARYLLEQFNGFDSIGQAQQLEFKLNGKKQYLEVLPFKDGFGLDWLIVVVVPESDFMAEIDVNTRTTFALCLVTLAIALLTGVALTRWVTSPILRLNAAVKDIATGNWERKVDLDRTDELGQLAESINLMTQQLKTSFNTLEVQRNSFSRFFPSEYLRFLAKDAVTDVELGDHVSKEMAIMFSDIRSFTTFSEKMSPQATFNFINAYLQRVSPAIRDHNGVIVKFLGDGMMAVFPDAADDAVSAGITKLRYLEAFNQELEANGSRPIAIGMGIHMGHVMVGIVGEHNRMQADTLSDIVNLTSRLEGLTKFYGVSLIISENVLKALKHPENYRTRFLDRAIVMGRTEAIAIYEVFDAEPEPIRQLKEKTLSDFENALEYYRLGHPTAAREWLEKVLFVNPHDRTAILYLERVALLQERGIPKNWDGVWAFTQK
ncbi:MULTISPECIES: adenylate/guanylate cyclase domain-containing protein [unclassified Leptolyngbya]|uniref:cache domain-containing protein n=1 Tax=unclassified Leptolyngbya TaxID=2650499 RepID=UPI001686AA0C|nr:MULTISPECIES: adenylate/guanylate cyclase domain-containing protein [unclassified Leptolyngbya]MBD1910425.1 HAMP domain-containing protein [Leptolyngbya sp. FACHB-8]MBD2154193.1 HAMP domain-containing protein [Leptolyngbya sp. FACHB-16]